MYYYTDGKNYLSLFEPLQNLGLMREITKKEFELAIAELEEKKRNKRKRK